MVNAVFGRYALSGGLLTVVGYCCILALTHLSGISPYSANLVVYLVGFFVSYWLNARIVFRKSPGAASFLRFVGSFALAYGANLLALSTSLEALKLGQWLAQLLATMIYVLVHFTVSRTYVFR